MAGFPNQQLPQGFAFSAGMLSMLAVAWVPARLYSGAWVRIGEMSVFAELFLWPVAGALGAATLMAAGFAMAELYRQFRKFRNTSSEVQQSKARFLHGLSEQLREPMTGLVGMTDLLLNSELTPDQKDFAGVIQQSAHSLLGMLNNLLEYARLDDGTIQPQVSDFDLHGLIEDAILGFVPEAERKRLLLACCISPAVPRIVRGDPVLLTRLLRVLLDNAVRYTHRGEVVLSARPAQDDGRHVSVCFDVADTGVGIAAEKQLRLFRRDGRREEIGSGFGLAIAQLIAARLHGQVDLNSEPGKGSVFWAVLRFEQSATGAELEPGPAINVDLKACLCWHNKSVRKMLVWKLAVLGVSCATVQDGEEIPEGTRVLFVEGAAEINVPEGVVIVRLLRADEEARPGTPYLQVPLRLPALKALLREVAANLKSRQLAGLAGHLKENQAGQRSATGEESARTVS